MQCVLSAMGILAISGVPYNVPGMRVGVSESLCSHFTQTVQRIKLQTDETVTVFFIYN